MSTMERPEEVLGAMEEDWIERAIFTPPDGDMQLIAHRARAGAGP